MRSFAKRTERSREWLGAGSGLFVASGGARTRSGPPADPTSGRSDRRGFTLTALPSEGFSGDVPALSDFLPAPSDRHEAVWAQLWTTPQACAWSLEAWRWPVVADLVKWLVRSEPADAPASLGTVVRQLRDDVGLSKAGLVANGWAIAVDEVGAKAAAKDESKPARRSSRDRMKVVPGAAAGA